MYLDFAVEIPDISSKITYRKKNDTVYVYYEYERKYNPETQKTNPRRATIGKRLESDPNKMWPNQNYLKYFPEVELPEEKDRGRRSSSLRIGDYLVIKKIMEQCELPGILGRYLSEKDLGLFMDLAAYSIVTENSAGQYYPNYAYCHPLFTKGMRIYSDTRVSDFLHSLDPEVSVAFLNDWNSARDHREKIYISYDSTNKNCQAGDIEIVEFGYPKDDRGLPVFNYSIAYDTNNREPLFYEQYPGSINDISQLEFVLDKAFAYGYRKIGFILDRGYFSRKNLQSIDEKGYSFVIMLKGMADLVRDLILDKKGTFEKKRVSYIDDYSLYGTTVRKKLYVTDEKERYVHLYHSVSRESAETIQLESKIRQMKRFMDRHINEVREFGSGFRKYFDLYYNEKTGQFQFYQEKITVIEKELELCGYFCIVTSEKMTAKEAIRLYKSRDASEKLFRGDKSYLGNSCLRVYGDDAATAKIFIEFTALIIRNRIYTCLQEKLKSMEKKPNYMTVPAALKELEKIEMSRMADGRYRLDHAVTKTQKTILNAFGMDVPYVKYQADKISKALEEDK